MILDLGIYDTSIAGLENFEVDGDNFASTRAAAKKVAAWERATAKEAHRE